MGFFDAPAFSSFFIFLGALCAKSVHIAIVTKDDTIKVYGDPQEGARVMGEAVARGKRRSGEHLPQSILKPLTKPLGDMSEMCAKKAATACVAHMLGVTGKTLIKWGKVDAVFWGTSIPMCNTKFIAEIATKYGFKDDYFSLEKVIKWENMSSLSHVKVNSMNVGVSRKDFYYLIVETCFVQCGAPMVQVNVENPALDDSLVVMDNIFLDPVHQQVNLSMDGSFDNIEQVEQVARDASWQVPRFLDEEQLEERPLQSDCSFDIWDEQLDRVDARLSTPARVEMMSTPAREEDFLDFDFSPSPKKLRTVEPGQLQVRLNIGHQGGALGLSLVKDKNGDIVISGIKDDGPAYLEGSLQVGHRLLYVNHWEVKELSVKEVERVVRCSGDVITLIYDGGPEDDRHGDLELSSEADLSYLVGLAAPCDPSWAEDPPSPSTAAKVPTVVQLISSNQVRHVSKDMFLSDEDEEEDVVLTEAETQAAFQELAALQGTDISEVLGAPATSTSPPAPEALDASPHITPGVVAKFAASLGSPRLETVLAECDQDRDALQVIYVSEHDDLFLCVRVSDGVSWCKALVPRYKRISPTKEMDLLTDPRRAITVYSIVVVKLSVGHPITGDLVLSQFFRPPLRQFSAGQAVLIGSPQPVYTPTTVDYNRRGRRTVAATSHQLTIRDLDMDLMMGLECRDHFPPAFKRLRVTTNMLRIATSASRVTNGLRLVGKRHLYLLSYAQTAGSGGLKWQVRSETSESVYTVTVAPAAPTKEQRGVSRRNLLVLWKIDCDCYDGKKNNFCKHKVFICKVVFHG